MKIGELAQRSGLTPSRLRFYEAGGLIRSVERKGNGYRDYAAETLWTLEIITSAQRAGFSLDEIRNLLPDGQDQWPHEELLASLARKVAEIEVLQQRLAQNRAQLLLAIESIKTRPADLPCTDRAQWVLDRMREGRAGPGQPSPAGATPLKPPEAAIRSA